MFLNYGKYILDDNTQIEEISNNKLINEIYYLQQEIKYLQEKISNHSKEEDLYKQRLFTLSNGKFMLSRLSKHAGENIAFFGAAGLMIGIPLSIIEGSMDSVDLPFALFSLGGLLLAPIEASVDTINQHFNNENERIDKNRELLKMRVYKNIINENIIELYNRGITYDDILNHIEELDNYVPHSMILNIK